MRPWLALEMIGRPYEELVIPLYQPETKTEILKYGPSGRVPILKDGDVTVWDSLAILEYRAERSPRVGLWPDAPAIRAMARSVSAEMHAGFPVLRQHCFMDVLSVYDSP